jgi:hypothetical protein
MGGLSNAFWFWIPVLIFKAISAVFRTLWKFNLWTLQTVSGVPLYYCRPEYRIPAIFLGTFGVIACLNFVLFFFVVVGSAGSTTQQGGPALQFFIAGLFGVGLLLACRFLIRRGSI